MLMGSEAASDIPIANRFKFVNWQNLGPLPEGATQPRTHEFREYRGTLNMEEIGQWVMFHSPKADSRTTSCRGYAAYFADQVICTSQ